MRPHPARGFLRSEVLSHCATDAMSPHPIGQIEKPMSKSRSACPSNPVTILRNLLTTNATTSSLPCTTKHHSSARHWSGSRSSQHCHSTTPGSRGSTAGVTPSRMQVAPRRGLPQLRAFLILFTIAHRMHIPATLVEGHHYDTRCCTTLKPGPSQKSLALPQNQKTLPQKRTAPSCPHSSANRPPQTAAQIGRQPTAAQIGRHPKTPRIAKQPDAPLTTSKWQTAKPFFPQHLVPLPATVIWPLIMPS